MSLARSLLFLLLCLPFLLFSSSSVPSSCLGLEDGVYTLNLMDDEDNYPNVVQKCSNEYVILNAAMDTNIESYFDSWRYWHRYTVGPNIVGSLLNWEQWYLPSNAFISENADYRHEFLVSPDCSSCDVDNNLQYYDTQTSYYMTGNLFGCFWRNKGVHNCDVDYDTLECYACSSAFTDAGYTRIALNEDITDKSLWENTGICPTNIRSSDHLVPETHDDCSRDETKLEQNDGLDVQHLQPSLGVNGKFCVCAKPGDELQASGLVESSDNDNVESLDEDDIYVGISDSTSITENDDLSESTLGSIPISSSDFVDGTYRITSSGYYKLTEDIEFNFNYGDNDSPHAVGAWWPTSDQNDVYPGAGTYRDAYFMGFFAGITIECDSVVLDLNGYELRMSESFYHQQRWFTVIELSSQYFLPGQGIGHFGPSPTFGTNVVIKNGYIGLSSHHGIHGNYNTYLTLSNLKIRNFETHGIQLNGFTNIKLEDLDIGPTSSLVKFSGEYAHMRAVLYRLKSLAESIPDETITFSGRSESVTLQDLADELDEKMTMVWQYVVTNKDFDSMVGLESDYIDKWKDAKEIFLNVNNDYLPYGSVQYGIFLNTHGASVFTYNLYTNLKSSNAYLNNIDIHDMSHKMIEYVRLHTTTKEIYRNPLNAPMDLEKMIDLDAFIENDYDTSNLQYVGNIISDAYFAMNKLGQSEWGMLQAQLLLNDVLVAWALGDYDDDDNLLPDSLQIGCNSDVMLHSGKGIIGLRIDGVENVEINNLNIYNLKDSTPLGKSYCGEYSKFDINSEESGGHFQQTWPMQIGFSGNMNQGICLNANDNIKLSNIVIHDLESETGAVFGISLWPNNENIIFNGDITIYNLNAGTSIDEGELTYNDRPNKAPEACGVRVYFEFVDQSQTGATFYTDVTFANEPKVISSCLTGHVSCAGSDTDSEDYTMLGVYQSCNSKTNIINSINKENNSSTMSSKKTSNYNLMIMIVLSISFIWLVSAIIYNKYYVLSSDYWISKYNNYKKLYSSVS